MLRKAAVARCKRLLQHSAQVDGPVAFGVPPLGQKPRKNVLPPHGHKRSGAGCWGRAEQSHQETPSVHSPSGNVCVTCLRPGVDEDGHVPLDRWGRLRHHCVAHQRRAARRAVPSDRPRRKLGRNRFGGRRNRAGTAQEPFRRSQEPGGNRAGTAWQEPSGQAGTASAGQEPSGRAGTVWPRGRNRSDARQEPPGRRAGTAQEPRRNRTDAPLRYRT